MWRGAVVVNAGSGLPISTTSPAGWTSADAAGLAILPGLVRYDEAFGPGEILHAFRVTLRATNGYVYTASHRAGRRRARRRWARGCGRRPADDISGFTPQAQEIFRAMQRYGLIVADNGSDMYVSGTFDTRWNNDVLNPAFRALTAADFEVVELGYRPNPTPAAPTNLRITS